MVGNTLFQDVLNLIVLLPIVIIKQVGDILLGNIRPYLKKIWLADCNGGTNGDVLVVHITKNEGIKPRFLYHVLASDRFFLYAAGKTKAGKMPRGDKEAIMRYAFRLPNVKEQERIANILNRFDALCNDETAGLAAEIAARKKQYEHYRDRLLTFKRKETV